MSDAPSATNAPGTPAAPLLRVVRGEPTAVELAALVAVVSTRAVAADSVPAAEPVGWGTRESALRRPMHPGPGAWKASGLPS